MSKGGEDWSSWINSIQKAKTWVLNFPKVDLTPYKIPVEA